MHSKAYTMPKVGVRPTIHKPSKHSHKRNFLAEKNTWISQIISSFFQISVIECSVGQ